MDNKFTYRNKTKQCHMRADREKNIQTDIITILHTLSEKLLTEKSTNSHFNFVLSGLARLNWVLRQKDRSVGCPRQHGVIHKSTAATAGCRQQSIYPGAELSQPITTHFTISTSRVISIRPAHEIFAGFSYGCVERGAACCNIYFITVYKCRRLLEMTIHVLYVGQTDRQTDTETPGPLLYRCQLWTKAYKLHWFNLLSICWCLSVTLQIPDEDACEQVS